MGLLKLWFIFLFSWCLYFAWANIFWPAHRRPIVARSTSWLQIAVINRLQLFFVFLFFNWNSILFVFALQFLLFSFQLYVSFILQKPLFTLWGSTLCHFEVLVSMWLLANLVCLPPPGWGWLLHQYLTDSRYSLSRGIFLARRLHHRWVGCGLMPSNLGIGICGFRLRCCWNTSLLHRPTWLLTVTIFCLLCCFIEIFFIPIWITICRVFSIYLSIWHPIFLFFTIPSSKIGSALFSLNRQ